MGELVLKCRVDSSVIVENFKIFHWENRYKEKCRNISVLASNKYTDKSGICWGGRGETLLQWLEVWALEFESWVGIMIY